MERPKYSKEEMVGWISRFKYGNIHDRAYQKEIIDIFVNAVYVYDDKIVFTYNFKDGTEALTLRDVEAAFGSEFFLMQQGISCCLCFGTSENYSFGFCPLKYNFFDLTNRR